MSSRTRTRFAKRIALGLAVAAVAVPVASAKPVPGLLSSAPVSEETSAQLPNGPVSEETSVPYLTVTEQGQYGIPSGRPAVAVPLDHIERFALGHHGDAVASSGSLVRETPDGYQPQLKGEGARGAITWYYPVQLPGDESTTSFVRDQPDGYQPQLRGDERVPVSTPTAEPGSGFDWSDAGIGFGLAAGIALLGGIAMGILGRGKLATGH